MSGLFWKPDSLFLPRTSERTQQFSVPAWYLCDYQLNKYARVTMLGSSDYEVLVHASYLKATSLEEAQAMARALVAVS